MKDLNLTHVDKENATANMVNITQKSESVRCAIAEGRIFFGTPLPVNEQSGELLSPKGPVIQTALIAGTMGAKRTSELIPMCHGLNLERIDLDFKWISNTELLITSTAGLKAKTGVEMEALTAVSIAALTVYDMCKSLDVDMKISGIQLMEKTGGKSDFKREP